MDEVVTFVPAGTLSEKRPDVASWKGTTLRRTVRAPFRARQALRLWLGSDYAAVRSDAEQVLAELVNNSVLHVPAGRGDWVKVRLGFGDGFVRLDVIDPGIEVPEDAFIPCHSGDLTEYGRGLLITQALSARWGTELLGRQRSVWCDIALPASAGATAEEV